VYVLSGILPVEAQIQIRTLGLFNNICNQADNSIEKNLARRQLIVKSNESSSWFIEIKYILRKYNLQEARWYLDNPPKKSVWTSTVKRKIYEHWSKSIIESISYYKSPQYLSCENLGKGKLHPILKINCKSKGDLHRLPIKLKLLTGAYILQSNRIKMYKNEPNALCLLCEKDGETIEHFILDCEQLKEVREPIIQKIDRVLNDCKLNWRKLSENVQLQLLLDITASTRNLKLDPASVANIEYCARRLTSQLHILRCRKIMDRQGTNKHIGIPGIVRKM
jgi:hypothetical protein